MFVMQQLSLPTDAMLAEHVPGLRSAAGEGFLAVFASQASPQIATEPGEPGGTASAGAEAAAVPASDVLPALPGVPLSPAPPSPHRGVAAGHRPDAVTAPGFPQRVPTDLAGPAGTLHAPTGPAGLHTSLPAPDPTHGGNLPQLRDAAEPASAGPARVKPQGAAAAHELATGQVRSPTLAESAADPALSPGLHRAAAPGTGDRAPPGPGGVPAAPPAQARQVPAGSATAKPPWQGADPAAAEGGDPVATPAAVADWAAARPQVDGAGPFPVSPFASARPVGSAAPPALPLLQATEVGADTQTAEQAPGESRPVRDHALLPEATGSAVSATAQGHPVAGAHAAIDPVPTDGAGEVEDRGDMAPDGVNAPRDFTGRSAPALPPAAAQPGLAPSIMVAGQLGRAAAGLGAGTVEVTLMPEELGRVRMTLVATDQGLSLSLIADRQETVELLRRNIGELAQEFRDLGFRNPSFTFAQGGDRRPTPQRGDDTAATPEPAGTAEAGLARTAANPHRRDGLDLRI